MELGPYTLQVFTSLILILGAACVALICDFLKGNNEKLRELTIELKVRREEECRRVELMMPYVLATPEGRAAAGVVDEHEDTLAVKLAVLLRLGAQVRPGAQEVAHSLCHRGQPNPAARCGPVGGDQLDLGMRPLGGREIAAFPGRVDRGHEVQVL